MTRPRQVKGDEAWEWSERDKLGACTQCGNHPLHCLCGEVVGHIKRWTLEELEKEQALYYASHQQPKTVHGFLSWITPTGEQA